jgi:glycosyltransferase involved in cell wall biosynthesis
MHDLKFAICLPRVIHPAAKGGGYLNTMRFAHLLAEHVEVRLVSYREREAGIWHLPDAEARLKAEKYILVLLWGTDVTPHIKKYYGKLPIIYYHKGIDFGVQLKPDIPILCNSKYLMAHAQENWPANPQFYLPPVLERNCCNFGQARDIEVLIIRRKQPSYIFDRLVPLLRNRCRLHVLDNFVGRDELFQLFNRTKIYLYAYAPQRTNHSETGWRMMEGFGTQPLEAMACGCTVFSNLRGGMADFVEPGTYGYRLESHSPEWDAHQILNAVQHYPQPEQADYEQYIKNHYGEVAFHKRIRCLLQFLSGYFPFAEAHPANLDAFQVPVLIGTNQRIKEQIIGALYRWKCHFTNKVLRKNNLWILQ